MWPKALFLALLLGLDIATKSASNAWIPALLPKIFGYPYGGIPIFACLGVSFSLNTVINTGSALGFFQGHSSLLFALRSVIISALVAYLLFFQREKKSPFFLWLVVMGAIGNGLDYLIYGHVIDFLHVCFWGSSFPIFNLADCYITIGVLALLLFSPARELSKS